MGNTILGKITIITISIVKLAVLENCRGKSLQKYFFKHTKQHRKHFVQPLKLMLHACHQSARQRAQPLRHQDTTKANEG